MRMASRASLVFRFRIILYYNNNDNTYMLGINNNIKLNLKRVSLKIHAKMYTKITERIKIKDG